VQSALRNCGSLSFSADLARVSPNARTTCLEADAASLQSRQQILDEVATSHLWLAETLARRFLHRGEDEQDLLQVARTWLVEACRR
jgi:DNA-directed RNA polymerase specialized sigma subunit